MKHIKNSLKEVESWKKTVFLFTGDKGSALLMDVVKDMDVRTVFIDTGYHFNEIMNYVKSYGERIEIIQNNNASADPKDNMVRCCGLRKMDTLRKYLEDVNAEYLIVPFRNEEKDTMIEDSYLNGISNIKIIKPLADFSERDVWICIKENNLPFSQIYKKGYRFVDCRCCTTRHGRKIQKETAAAGIDHETEEKLKSLGYM